MQWLGQPSNQCGMYAQQQTTLTLTHTLSLTHSLAHTDVLCLQECYSSLVCGGDFRDRIIAGKLIFQKSPIQ